jgi:hypothetical protein
VGRGTRTAAKRERKVFWLPGASRSPSTRKRARRRPTAWRKGLVIGTTVQVFGNCSATLERWMMTGFITDRSHIAKTKHDNRLYEFRFRNLRLLLILKSWLQTGYRFCRGYS